jgi:hypothetical protein
MMGTRGKAPRALRLLALAALVGLLTCLLPLGDALLAGPADLLVRSRGVTLARELQVDHDLASAAPGSAFLEVPGLAPDPVRLPPPAVAESGRADERGASGWAPSPGLRPDLSRSPPGR